MGFDNLDSALQAYRSHWEYIQRVNIDLRTALSIQHGIVERIPISQSQWTDNIADYLSKSLERLKTGEVENAATIIELSKQENVLGLP